MAAAVVLGVLCLWCWSCGRTPTLELNVVVLALGGWQQRRECAVSVCRVGDQSVCVLCVFTRYPPNVMPPGVHASTDMADVRVRMLLSHTA